VSGQWTGFYMQWGRKGKQDLMLEFKASLVSGSGSDGGGDFVVRGSYDAEAGRVSLVKKYDFHTVEYDGHAEGNGIWGGWKIRAVGYVDHGGFHIWPRGFGQGATESIEAEAPVEQAAEPVESGKQ
jgi:hypothetical protein